MTRDALRLLAGLDLHRLQSSIRHPAPGRIAGVAIPLVLAVALLWAVGRAGGPVVTDAEDAVLLAMLVAGPISYLAYGTLFRAPDAPLLRRLGVPPRAVYAERAARHLGQALGLAVLALIPFVAAGSPLGPPALAAVAAGLATWGVGAAFTAGAGLAMSHHAAGAGWGCLMAGIQDREVAGAAPLAYAPLPGFLAGIVAGGAVGANGWLLLAALPLAILSAMAGAARYEAALPRFGPLALEMAFSPTTDPRGGELRVGRGLARILPRAVRAVQARDAVVVARRFPWATRIAWPVAIGGSLALGRWGTDPAVRAWVAGAVAMVLLAQALAGIGLGRTEAGGPRWIDRSVGAGPAARLAGRWAWGWGLSLWMTIPIALAWGWWTGASHGWGWILAGGAVAGLGALASSLAAAAR